MALSAGVQESSYLVQLACSIGISKLSNLAFLTVIWEVWILLKTKRFKHKLNILTFAIIFLQKNSADGIKLFYCPTQVMLADILTKALPSTSFLRYSDSMGIINASNN